MNIDGNLSALKREEDEQERSEARHNRAVKEFRDGMDDAIDILVGVFNSQSSMSSINRLELIKILLEDVGAQL